MGRIHVYSEKLQKMLEFDTGAGGRLVPAGASALSGDFILNAWNNSSDNWIDNGWNNSSDNWQDKGWNNSAGSWMDKGWNNSSSRWSDSGWSNSSDNWGDSGGGGGGCFITTACVEEKGFADDCDELQTLRKYRDILVEQDEAFRGKVIEYYRKAPMIIQAIDGQEDRHQIYGRLYDEMIRPCVDLLDSGETDKAKELYLDYYESLAEQYLADG